MLKSQISYDSRGAVLTIANASHAPGLQLKSYIYYGRVDATMQAAPGVGIATSIVLISDDLGEIDLVTIPTPLRHPRQPLTFALPPRRNGLARTRR